jgi:hypothetical protein
MCHHIEIPAFEQRQCLFDIETMELLALARFEAEGAYFDNVIHV